MPTLPTENLVKFPPGLSLIIPVYEMATFFLVKVMVRPTLEELNNKVDLQDLDAVVYSLENDWHMWVEHYISYVMIMAFGIAFAVVLCMHIYLTIGNHSQCIANIWLNVYE